MLSEILKGRDPEESLPDSVHCARYDHQETIDFRS